MTGTPTAVSPICTDVVPDDTAPAVTDISARDAPFDSGERPAAKLDECEPERAVTRKLNAFRLDSFGYRADPSARPPCAPHFAGRSRPGSFFPNSAAPEPLC